MSDEQQGTGAGIWSVIAAVGVVTGGWMIGRGLGFDWTSAVLPAFLCLGLQALSYVYRRARRDLRLATALEGAAQLTAFTAIAGTLSYVVASTGGALWDETLRSWDLGLGLDWRAYLSFVDSHPVLGLIYTLAYRSIMPQMIIAVTALSFTGRVQAARAFVLAFIMAASVTILISALMPAMAMFVSLGLQPGNYPHLDPTAAFVHVGPLTGLRDGTLRIIALDRIEGIITFPSFHACLGVLFMHAFWPLGWMRWPALVLNVLLIAATPIDGGHYFVDLIAGAVIAVAAIRVAGFLVGRAPAARSRSVGAWRRAPARPNGAGPSGEVQAAWRP